MILARLLKNHAQAHVSHVLSRGCWNQKWQVSLEAGKAGAYGEGVRVEMSLMNRCRSTFEQFDSRALSATKKYMTEMVNGTPGVVALEPVTKERWGKSREKEEGGGGGRTKAYRFFFFFFFMD
jgi:hypothetical protein